MVHTKYKSAFCMNHTKSTKKEEKLKSSQKKKKDIGLVILPFISGMTERLKRLLKNHQIKVATKPLRTVRNMLPSLKAKINKFDQRGAVYRIPYLDGTGVYIGESG